MRIDRTFKQYTDAEDKDLIGFLKIFSGRSAGSCDKVRRTFNVQPANPEPAAATRPCAACGSGYTKQATTAHL